MKQCLQADKDFISEWHLSRETGFRYLTPRLGMYARVGPVNKLTGMRMSFNAHNNDSFAVYSAVAV